jgi:hypothetical protein
MIWLLTRPIVWPVKATGYSVAAGYKTGRFVGYRRVTVFLLGVAVGVLLAPVPGRQLRAKLQERFVPRSPIALPASTAGPLLMTRDADLVDLTE